MNLPTIIIDSREQTPLVFTRLPTITVALLIGEHSVAGLEDHYAVERKSTADLVASCVGDNRDRFFRELHRLRGFPFMRLLVVGTMGEIERDEYRSQVKPAAVLATLAATEARFDVPVVFATTQVEGARRIESRAYWFAREQIEYVNSIARATGLTKSVNAHAQTQ